MASKALDVNIYHRDESGKPDETYHPRRLIATYLVKSIDICRGMLKTTTVRSAFATLAEEYIQERRTAGPAPQAEAVCLSKTFLDMVFDRFPNVFVDDSLKNPNLLAVHCRRQWAGVFETSDQYILLNGRRLRQMLGSGIIADTTPDKDALNSQDHRAFLFMFANAFLHEIAHVFLTYLTEGNEITPPSMRAYVTGTVNKTEGESGRRMEQLVFGGAMNYKHDPITNTPNNHCGIPYLNTETGWYRIKQETIDETVEKKFKFPYEHSETKELYRPLLSMGFGMSKDDITDPLDHGDWPKLRNAPPPTAR